MMQTDLIAAVHQEYDAYSFSRDHAKRIKCDPVPHVVLPLQPLGSDVGADICVASTDNGNTSNDEDLVNALLYPLSLKSNGNDDDIFLERELSRCLSFPWMFEEESDGACMPCMNDTTDEIQNEGVIMKRVRSTGNFILISEDPTDMKTPFLVQQEAADGQGKMIRSPSSDESSDDYFSQEQQEIERMCTKRFKLVCLAGYMKSLVTTTYSSRHVASGVPCITPTSIEECLAPRKYAADDLVQRFFDSARISGTR